MRICEAECYDKRWLRKDMENMGFLFEYCDKYCMQLFNVKIDKLLFLNAFMRSNFRIEMERGHDRLLSQSAFDSVDMFVNVDCDGDILQFEGACVQWHKNQMYWVGWMYAYLHFRTKMPSAELVEKLPILRMLEEYYLGHEMDREVFYERIESELK